MMQLSARIGRSLVRLLAVIGLIVMFAGSVSAQGTYLSAAGPVNRGMGGASTAAPIDALGAIYWNPATISGLDCSQLEAGLDLLYSNQSVASSVGPFSGLSQSENGFMPIPNVGWVHHTENPAVTIGLGINAVAGFKTNLMSSTANPVLAPQPVGLGRVSSEASFLQIAPVVSVALSEGLSVGFGPTVTVGQAGLEPFVFAPPNANGHYSSGRASRYAWGGGAQAGVYYIRDNGWHFGASVKTPQWMETLRFFGEDAAGAPRVLKFHANLPLIVSLGTAYAGIENWIFALDVRYFDYAGTAGLGDPATFNATGALQGLGWDSVVAVALGAQRRVSENFLIRAGYTFNQSPINNGGSFFSLGTPLFYRHMLSAGATYQLSPAAALNAAYSYVLPEELVGPIVSPVAGVIPGSAVHNRLDAHVLSIGISVNY